jgi:hypothetical protein
MIGIGAIAGVVALSSTLAASINLNDGAPVEFGQGIAQTTACSNGETNTNSNPLGVADTGVTKPLSKRIAEAIAPSVDSQ